MEDADVNEFLVKNYVNKIKKINQLVEERSRDFDGTHCVFCGAEIRPRERVTELKKTYCKKCAERFFKW